MNDLLDNNFIEPDDLLDNNFIEPDDLLDNNFIEPDCDDVSRETSQADFSELVIPTSFEEAMSYEQQIIYLYQLFTDYKKGVSPEVTIEDIPGGHRITITDEDHPDGQSFDVMDGEQGQDGRDGQDGQDGISPTVTITSITNGHRVTITDADHPQGQSFDVMNGEKGDKGETGESGFSPEVSITSITGGHRISITDADDTQTFDVMDGQDGQAIPPVITAQATVGSGTGTPSVTVTKSGTDEAPTYTFAFDNLKGANGTDGVSPTVTVRSITGGHQIEIVSAGGTERFDVKDGVDGSNGSDGTDGVSPTVSTTAITDGTRVTITDAQGSHTFDVMNGTDGTDGTDGSDGISPTVTVRDITGGHQIEIVSAGGTERFDVMDGSDGSDGQDGTVATIQVGTVTTGAAGTNASVTNSGTSSAAVFDFTIPRGADGENGQTGPAGPGVASGGTAGQILAKASGTDYDTEWINPPSGGEKPICVIWFGYSKRVWFYDVNGKMEISIFNREYVGDDALYHNIITQSANVKAEGKYSGLFSNYSYANSRAALQDLINCFTGTSDAAYRTYFTGNGFSPTGINSYDDLIDAILSYFGIDSTDGWYYSFACGGIISPETENSSSCVVEIHLVLGSDNSLEIDVSGSTKDLSYLGTNAMEVALQCNTVDVTDELILYPSL